jgi:hypothetical protein
VGWQARSIEMADTQRRYYYHPYQDVWVPVMYRDNPQCEWVPLEGFEGWDPAKWIMSHGARRNGCLMGYDSARAFNAARPGKKRFCLVCEGPLDAARLGPPDVAVCGKSCSQTQAELLVEAFDVIIVVPDRDSACEKLPQYVTQWVGGSRPVFVISPPGHRKDAGEMTPDEARMFRIGAMMKAGVL